jgi:hypothetical protein
MWTNWGPLLKRQQAFKRGHNFGWKAFWDLHPDWSCISLESQWNSGTHVKPTYLGRVQDVPILSMLHHGIRFITEDKSMENLNQGRWKVTVGQDSECRHGQLLTGSHDMFVDTGLPWDTSGNQDQHLVRVDICRGAELRDSTYQLTLSWISQFCYGQQRIELPNPQEFSCCHCTKVNGSNVKEGWLKQLQFRDVWNDGPPDGKPEVDHRTDKLLIQQNSICDGQSTPPVMERIQHYQSMHRFLSHLIDESTRSAIYQGSPLDNGWHRKNTLAAQRA